MDDFIEKNENVSKYGEFVCTEHRWLQLEKQKQNAKRLEDITKNK